MYNINLNSASFSRCAAFAPKVPSEADYLQTWPGKMDFPGKTLPRLQIIAILRQKIANAAKTKEYYRPVYSSVYFSTSFFDSSSTLEKTVKPFSTFTTFRLISS